jgi:hypothetical protein
MQLTVKPHHTAQQSKLASEPKKYAAAVVKLRRELVENDPYQNRLPGTPLNGPARSLVIQPP